MKYVKLWMYFDCCLFCRISDTEKPNIIKMVRNYDPKRITLAIGDGANDIEMLKTAHVGVGIATVYDK